MKYKRIELTLVEKAIQAVRGFAFVFKKLSQQVTLSGHSQGTLNNYIRCIAYMTENTFSNKFQRLNFNLG